MNDKEEPIYEDEDLEKARYLIEHDYVNKTDPIKLDQVIRAQRIKEEKKTSMEYKVHSDGRIHRELE